MSALLDRILRAGEGKTIRRLEKIAASVNSLEADFHAMSDEELRGMTAEFKTRLANAITTCNLWVARPSMAAISLK